MARPPSSLSGCTRRQPIQERGTKRVEVLLAAAVAEFAASGYEAATMSAIATRANACIGSLYQFFPNKQAIARALRTRQIEDFEHLCTELQTGSVEPFVDGFVKMMVVFEREHPAFLPLLDAPSSTLPTGPRHRLRTRLEGMLRSLHPSLRKGDEARIAEYILQLNRATLGHYARSTPEERRWIFDQYRAILLGFLSRQFTEPAPKSRRAPASTRTHLTTPRNRPVES